MSLSEADYGVVTEGGTVRFERLLKGPIERVWRYLADADKRATWFAGGELEPRAGGEGQLIFRHSDITSETVPAKWKDMPIEQTSHNRVLRYEPPHVLSISWGEASGQPSEVTFELSEAGDRVRLVLTHRKVGDRGSLVSFSGGWHAHLGQLEDALEGRPRRPFWGELEGLDEEYGRRTPG